MGFRSMISDRSVYVKREGGDLFIITVYEDGVLIPRASRHILQKE